MLLPLKQLSSCMDGQLPLPLKICAGLMDMDIMEILIDLVLY